MGALTKKIFFKAPLPKIWEILSDVTRTPEWVDGVQESEKTGEILEGKGLKWRERCLLERQNIEMEHEFTEWAPMKKVQIQTVLPMGGWMKRDLSFQEASQGTEILIHVEWDLGIAGMLVGEKKAQEIMERSLDATFENWKEKAEAF